MSRETEVSAISREVMKLLDDFGDIAKDALDESIEETAKEAKKKLRKFNRGKTAWKDYPKGWSFKVNKGRILTEARVYNKDNYRLTHLLEFGHALKNGGRTRAFPHIETVNEFAQKELEKKIREKLSL